MISEISPYGQWSFSENERRIRRLTEEGRPNFHSPWLSAAMTQMMSECVLQMFTLGIMGRTVHFGVQSGFYQVNSSQISQPVRQTYNAAIYYLVVGVISSIIGIIFALAALFNNWGKTLFLSTSKIRKAMFLLAFLWLDGTWLASWLFWSGFVKSLGTL
jgi:ABC-type uncharacterized transport system fused permease/ATPase subunit